jgi:hypothetical protein
LWCRCNFNYWIAAQTEWKSIEARDSSHGHVAEIETTAQNNKGPQLLGQLRLEITLTKRLPQRVESSILSKSTIINERSLTDDAFRPKSFTVTLEKGNFIEPCYIGYLSASSDKPRFALQLLFDHSPYPPRCEWKKPEGGPDGGQFFHHKQFVSRLSPDLDKRAKPMNDTSAGGQSGGCVVS